jgi:hypothetical protein
MIARERSDCNVTERMDKRNWSKLDHGRRNLALLKLSKVNEPLETKKIVSLCSTSLAVPGNLLLRQQVVTENLHMYSVRICTVLS